MSSVVAIFPSLVIGATPIGDSPKTNETRNIVVVAKDDDTLDFVQFPPTIIQTVSPGRHYVFVVQSSDAWRSKHATGRLLKVTPAGQEIVWEKVLAQEYGPRYSLVGDQGQIVLFDESINVKSRYAVVLINYQKNLEVTHDFDAIAQALGLPVATIVGRAKSGWWLEGTPSLDTTTGSSAMVAAAGKCLVIDLNTGRLSVASSPPPKCRK